LAEQAENFIRQRVPTEEDAEGILQAVKTKMKGKWGDFAPWKE
jgi:hypothetical protein